MKIWSVFSVVIVFHLAILGLLLIQPGCQSRPSAKSGAETAEPAAGVAEVEAGAPLDPAFNAGYSAPAATGTRSMSAPTRPAGGTRAAPETGVLEPVLEPVQEGLGLPAATISYTVQKGDTLSGIARKQGTSLDALLKANNLGRSSTIFPGQTLQIPAAAATVAAAPAAAEPALQPATAGKEVVVQKGDSLSKIAARTGTSVKAIKALNGLTSDTIRIGQRLLLPDSADITAAPAPAPVTQAAAATPPVAVGGASYTVQAGDTPGGIARKFGITANALMAANNITDARKIYPGQTLAVPSAGAAAAAPASRETSTTPVAAPARATPTSQDPMSVLEALEDEDLPFAEVEQIQEGTQPAN